MPAEAHQRGRDVRPDVVVELLCAVLGDVTAEQEGSARLAAVGVEDVSLAAPWGTVCEELAEHGVGPELEAGAFEVSTTLTQVANVCPELLRTADGHAR